MDVGADGVGGESLLQGGAGDLHVAVDARVSQVHDDAPVNSGLHFGAYLHVAVEHVLRVAVEGVGGDVSGAQELQHVGQRDGGAADVNHQAGAGLIGHGAGSAHGLVGVPVGDGVDVPSAP